LGGDKTSEAFRGYAVQGWSAPDITGGPLGKWTDDDIADYLKTGHNKYAAAAGLMGEVVQLSTSNMTDDDLKAIAVFLKDRSQVASPTDASVDQNVMNAGAAIYKDLCAACHQHDGQGVPNLFPRLSETPTVATADPTTVLRVIPKGTQTVATDGEPTGLAHAPGVSADQGKKAREALAARTN
jgi:mono/diheme cytochrome c family protein